MNNIIAVTMGDPDGIGPEVIRKTFSRYQPRHPVVILGDSRRFPDGHILQLKKLDAEIKPGIYVLPVKSGTEISFECVKTAVKLAREKRVHALVTGPISKKKWRASGIRFNGHTDYLARQTGTDDYCMFFWSEPVKVALFTTHLPLKDVFRHIKKERILRFVRFLDSQLVNRFSTKFTYFFSGLNPHAGEDGYLGHEEIEEIIPAFELLKKHLDIRGVFPPDSVFFNAGRAKDAVVVCWYHDQGLIPFKLLSNRAGVNLTLGLPFVRTSPDHGTAVEIAGRGVADPSSMIEAVKLADRLI